MGDLSAGGLPAGRDPRCVCGDRYGVGGVSSSTVELGHPNTSSVPASLRVLGRCQPQSTASCAGGLRQPRGATPGQRFCPQLAWGQAELAADGRARKQASISLCAPGQVAQIGSVGHPVPRSPIAPTAPREGFCSGEGSRQGAGRRAGSPGCSARRNQTCDAPVFLPAWPRCSPLPSSRSGHMGSVWVEKLGSALKHPDSKNWCFPEKWKE